MPLLLLKNLPRYERLLEAAREIPDLDPSATEVFLHLLRSGDEAFRVVGAHLAQHEITQGGFGVLMALWENCHASKQARPLSPAALAERTSVTRATMTGLVDTLARAGLVTRTPDPKDRRMLAVELTPRGDKLLRKILPEHCRRMAWLVAPLAEGERKAFVRLLTKIIQRAAETMPPPNHAFPAANLLVHA
jgi:DNA-binding MarR family transcriptional regulator